MKKKLCKMKWVGLLFLCCLSASLQFCFVSSTSSPQPLITNQVSLLVYIFSCLSVVG